MRCMENKVRVSKKMLNETAIDFILAFRDRATVTVRLDDCMGDGAWKHRIVINGDDRIFRSNGEAYRFMRGMLDEYAETGMVAGYVD